MNPDARRDLLIEIGTEEIPTSYILPALEDMKTIFGKFCESRHIDAGEVDVYATPRRLALLARGVAESRRDSVLEVKGPPASAAVGPDGAFTTAALKFAASRGATPEDLEVRDTPKGQFLFVVKKQKGLPAADELPELLQDMISDISFPKSMRWGAYRMRFARPVRWVVFLFGDEAIEVELDGMRSGRMSRGHRFLHNEDIEIPSPAAYLETLEKYNVMADHNARRASIAERVRAISGGVPQLSDALLDDVMFLVEYPYVGLGEFEKDHLRLPREVLELCIEKTQHYVPIRNPERDELLPRFCVVMNVPLTDSKTVIQGYQKVLHSRLKDAMFFYVNDLKIPLEERVEDLKRIVFQQELGSLFDKTQRLESLVDRLADRVEMFIEDRAAADRAAHLCKADLTTSIVFEFTDLQGIMGMHFALDSGEPAHVAKAIGEHYMPRFADDALPATSAGRILALADKLDTIVGYFAVGLIPSGSMDPYSLRRQALGVVRILDAAKFAINIPELLDIVMDNFADVIAETQRDEIKAKLMEFFDIRVRTYFIETRGMAYDVVNAVDYRRFESVNAAARCAAAVSNLRAEEPFQQMLEVFTRVSNIMKKSATSDDFKGGDVSAELLVEPAEKTLHDVFYVNVAAILKNILENNNPVTRKEYEAAIRQLYTLTAPAVNFFDNVMVMAEDRAVRANRLALLSRMKDLYLKIADFSAIVKGQ